MDASKPLTALGFMTPEILMLMLSLLQRVKPTPSCPLPTSSNGRPGFALIVRRRLRHVLQFNVGLPYEYDPLSPES
ncbi:hypothetical protein MRB53_000312 [Persea americana]|uniref:Uncharacterized protein n=1 Tax=Persea americana TaxID=3435 RepID=A0ACC2MNI6_PERAE|nr:hypothetical protein MRB53_000312 [Persea americana]